MPHGLRNTFNNRRSLAALMGMLVLCTFTLTFISTPSAYAETFREALKKAQALEDEEKEEEAINAYILAKSMAPNPYNDARLGLARMYAKLGRYSEADSEYQAMLPATTDKSLKYEYGQFLLNQGRFDAASSVWNNLVSEDPKDVIALYHMGACLEGSDSIDSAKEYFQRAIDLSPDSNVGAAAKQKLARLTKATDVRQKGKFFPIDPDLGQAGLGWWDLYKMPLHVYIDDGSHVEGYRSSMKNYVYRALEAWNNAAHGRIGFHVDPPDAKGEWEWRNKMNNKDPLLVISADPKDIPEDPIKTDIHFHWTDKLGGVAVGLAWTNSYADKASGKKKKTKDSEDEEADDDDSKKDEGSNANPDGGKKNEKEERGKDEKSDEGKKDEKSTKKPETKFRDFRPAKPKVKQKKGDPDAIIRVAHIWLHTNSLADGSPIPEQINAANAAVLERQDRCMQEVAIHELGHALGLPHSTNPKDIMCSGIFALNSSDLVDTRTLSRGDEASLSEHYRGFVGHGFPDDVLPGEVASPTVALSPQTSSGAGSHNFTRSTRVPLPAPVADERNLKFREILFDINSGKYQSSLEKLDKLIVSDPSNAGAHYLRAVSLVNLKNYKAAETAYKLVEKLSPGSALATKAADGLKKLSKP